MTNFGCKQCSRSFQSARALQQHVAAMHASSQQSRTRAVASNKKKPARPSQRSALVSQVPSAMGVQRPVGAPTARITLSGTDLLEFVPDVSKFASGELVTAISIKPQLLRRLGTLANAYQRIRYRKLVFRITSRCSTSTGGGYLAAFSADPADVFPLKDASAYLASNPSALSSPWWTSADIQANLPSRLFYTDPSSEVREYSPGSFLLACDAKATQPGAFSIYAHWQVDLESPTLHPMGVDDDAPVLVFQLKRDAGPHSSNALCAYNEDGSPMDSYRVSDLVEEDLSHPDYEGSVWRPPFTFSYMAGAELWASPYFILRGGELKFALNAKDSSGFTIGHSDVIFPRGSVFTRIAPSPKKKVWCAIRDPDVRCYGSSAEEVPRAPSEWSLALNE